MSSKYRNKYRIESTRMLNWNYGWKGYYYVTINTHRRIRHFGSIINGRMILSETGGIAMDELLKTPAIRPYMNITIDTYIIMPDHIHAIIHIGRNPYNSTLQTQDKTSKDATPGVSSDTPDGSSTNPGISSATPGDSSDTPGVSSATPGVSSATPGASSDTSSILPATPSDSSATPNVSAARPDSTPPSKQGPQRNNLSSILRGFKSAVTVRARQINPDFKWQERFHDRIIRDARGLSNVRRYIRNNPRNWKG